jgi:YHS domain-containing protein
MQKRIWIISVILLTGAVFVCTGCKKEEPAPAVSEQKTGEEVKKTTEGTAAAAVEQKLCPVMEAPIDKNVFIEYEGKKVYFCCADCVEKFKANPQLYLSKLPQFQK